MGWGLAVVNQWCIYVNLTKLWADGDPTAIRRTTMTMTMTVAPIRKNDARGRAHSYISEVPG